MIILAIDTSSDCGSVALTVSDEPAGEVRLRNSVQHSERLFRSIEFLLEASETRLEDVDLFVAARGPGSFTGLRVGLAAVEGLAFTTGREARAISTLTARAWSVGHTSALVAPVFDARRGEVYGALYRRTGAQLEELRSPSLERPEEFLASLPQEEILFCGSGMELCTSSAELHQAWQLRYPDPYLASAIAAMAAAGHEEPFEPLYLRPPLTQPATRSSGSARESGEQTL